MKDESVDYMTVITQVADSLRLLDDNNDLLPLDSLTIVDFVVALENQTKLTIPAASLRQEHFRSLLTVRALLQSLST